jgi:peroxiredoxin
MAFRWGGFALAALTLGLLATACAEPGEGGADAGAKTRTVAPDFDLTDLTGRAVRLSDFRGKTVVIDFWATWCPPCVFQVPELNAFWRSNEAAGDVAVLGVAVDVEGAEVVAPWAEEQGVEYTILLGDEVLAKKFGVLGFPTLVIVTPEGEIESLHVGLLETADLEKIVASLRG